MPLAGRALKADAAAKYLNSPETPFFHKGAVLYNHDKARAAAHELGAIIAVEGYMDVIALHRAGFPNTVAPLGTALTEDQLALLWKAAAEPTLCFDGDSAGIKAAYRALDLALPLLKPGHSLKFALLPEGQDPDDLLKAQGPEAVKAVIEAAEPLSDVMWRRALTENDRATPERKAQFERDLRGLLNQIGDETVRKHYMADLTSRFDQLFQRNRGAGNFRPRSPNFTQETVEKGAKSLGNAAAGLTPAQGHGGLCGGAKGAGTAGTADCAALSSTILTLLRDFLDEFAAAEFAVSRA